MNSEVVVGCIDDAINEQQPLNNGEAKNSTVLQSPS